MRATASRREDEKDRGDGSRHEFHDLGATLRHVRKVKRLRLKDVATDVGCSESLLSKIECDKAMPSLRMLHRITAALDTSIATLFTDGNGERVTLYRSGCFTLAYGSRLLIKLSTANF